MSEVDVGEVELLVADPGLAEQLPPAAREAATAAAWARTVRLPAGPWNVSLTPARFRGWCGMLVLDGMLARHVAIGAMGWSELLGRGDLLQPWTHVTESVATVPTEGRYEVLQRARLAVLDRDFAVRVAPWPEVTAALIARTIERSRWLTAHLASGQAAHIDERVWLALWHLADRFGRVTSRGCELAVPGLTHEALARMLGARRPTVTTSLRRLGARGLVTQPRRGFVVLHGDPQEGLARIGA